MLQAVEKCLMLYLGARNMRHRYRLSSRELAAVSAVHDLGVFVSDDLKWATHVRFVAAKAFARMNAILRCFTYSDFNLLARAYTVYVRPILETATVVWSPLIALLESVQRKFSRHIFVRCGLHDERLQNLGWTTLSERHIMHDLCFVLTLWKGL